MNDRDRMTTRHVDCAHLALVPKSAMRLQPSTPRCSVRDDRELHRRPRHATCWLFPPALVLGFRARVWVGSAGLLKKGHRERDRAAHRLARHTFESYPDGVHLYHAVCGARCAVDEHSSALSAE